MKKVLLAALFAVLTPGGLRASTPEPQFQTLESDGEFSLRRYPQMLIVVAPMKEGSGGSFRKLFGFISGKNSESAKIPMTAPVLIDQNRSRMSFIMPGLTAPQPTESSLVVQQMVAGRFAAVRFTGRRTTENENRALLRLRNWVDQRKLTATGEPLFAYYDPPWTLPFMRRNEVLIRVK